MKQHTTPDQTAKLIELGFEKPKFEIETQMCNVKGQPLRVATIVGDYSIGELLSFCPPLINSAKFGTATINIFHDVINWVVGYDDVNGVMRLTTVDLELVDALCTMCVKLKEEGVI